MLCCNEAFLKSGGEESVARRKRPGNRVKEKRKKLQEEEDYAILCKQSWRQWRRNDFIAISFSGSGAFRRHNGDKRVIGMPE